MILLATITNITHLSVLCITYLMSKYNRNLNRVYVKRINPRYHCMV